jgi:hypothetical protein
MQQISEVFAPIASSVITRRWCPRNTMRVRVRIFRRI